MTQNLQDVLNALTNDLSNLAEVLRAQPPASPAVGTVIGRGAGSSAWLALPVNTVVRDDDGDFWRRSDASTGTDFRPRHNIDWTVGAGNNDPTMFGPLTVVELEAAESEPVELDLKVGDKVEILGLSKFKADHRGQVGKVVSTDHNDPYSQGHPVVVEVLGDKYPLRRCYKPTDLRLVKEPEPAAPPKEYDGPDLCVWHSVANPSKVYLKSFRSDGRYTKAEITELIDVLQSILPHLKED